MSAKKIWSINFVTSAVLLILMIGAIVSPMNAGESETQVLGVYVAIIIGVYALLLGYLFFRNIYSSRLRNRMPFYLTSLAVFILSLYILFTFYDILRGGENISTWRVLLVLVCFANVITYTWGILSNKE
jgi:hypothetical protein